MKGDKDVTHIGGLPVTEATSIGFGAGEVVIVDIPMNEVRWMLQEGLANSILLEFEITREGATELIVINPLQVKVLQKT